ncbi:ATP-dependent helicase/nuclease subunit A [Polaromonas sp. OV174]|uniref:UvrD-helicase domain-containing protein n=1 Tax=Polaromonas sp. OV174 TaxID=1855300 RepID=UPI0008E6CFAD|nr:UvrD-helicase domain-containing protein [Polaromonas sp. OV174]SFC36288.1 ATP-dependent helicase/nuclease subunit A [Polaromonas sp. OV174]
MSAAYECNGQPVSADAFYAIACDPRRSVAVEACAGAGKTWMLVSRIVRAMLDGASADGTAQPQVRPHEILAITFTKKAAGEMRERLDEWLKMFSQADDATLQRELVMRGMTSQIGPNAPQDVRKQLSNLYRSVLASGRTVQIRTFHSWFAALLRSAPVAVLQRLGLPVNYDLLEDDAPARALVWRRFYAALLADEPLKADFEALVLGHGRFQTDKALQTALDKRIEFTLADEKGIVDLSVQPFDVQFPEFAGLARPEDSLIAMPANRQLLLDAAQALGRASAPTFSAKGVELEMAVTAQQLPGVFAALLTDKGTPRKFGEKIAGIEGVRLAQELVLRVQAASQQHEAWAHQQRMARLSRLLIAQFTQLKRERGWVDMNDVERAALVMLGDPVLAGWVQERLDARIKHLMIDEFQDTNPLQWQALSAWLSGYSGAGAAPSVFLVGDPKQSIYRFRRAEPQVFRAAQAFVVDGLSGDLLSCDHTRRNAQAVIASVNAAMGAARARDGYDGFREHSTDSQRAGDTGRLPAIPRVKAQPPEAESNEHWRDSLSTPRELPEETLRTLEARQAAAWIAMQMTTGLKPQDIMVLSRKRAGLLPLQQELRALHIPAQIGEKTDLIDCCEVLDLVALLDVLVSPQHDLSLARALRSPLFGLSDASLVQLALLQRELTLPWFELLQKTELLAPELQGLGAILMRWKGWLDEQPPHDALQAIYADGDVLARFVAAAPATQRQTVLANLRALLGVALERDGGRYVTPYGLIRALKAGGTLAPVAVNPDAVRLLTIHGAKGLEAEAVLLLDTDTVERSADSMGVLIDWPGEASEPHKFVFLVSESRPPACAQEALAAEQAARKREELNALYVALTRARHTLAISSIEPHRVTTDSWWQRLQGLGDGLMEELAAPVIPLPSESDTAPASDVFLLPELPSLPADAQATPAQAEFEAPDSLKARIGKAMHRLLEWGGPSSAQQVAAAAREFRLSPAQATEAQALALRILAGEGAWAWGGHSVAWQGNEVDLVYQGQPLRLDRLVQRKDAGHEDQWWVLDYKSAHAPQQQPALIAQLQTYRAAVQQIYPGAAVKAAFLTGQGTVVELV